MWARRHSRPGTPPARHPSGARLDAIGNITRSNQGLESEGMAAVAEYPCVREPRNDGTTKGGKHVLELIGLIVVLWFLWEKIIQR